MDAHQVPDLDFVLAISDRPTVPKVAIPLGRPPPPVFGYVRTPWHYSIPFPAVTFDPPRWRALHARLSTHTPLRLRLPTALWRGACNSLCDMMRGRTCALPGDRQLVARHVLDRTASRCPQVAHVAITSTHNNCPGAVVKNAVSMAAHARHALLIHVDGNGFSGRLEELFTLGGVVLKQASPFSAFYYPLLEPGLHFELVHANLTDLCDKVESLARSLPRGAIRRVGAGGHGSQEASSRGRAELLAAHAEHFARTFLSPVAVEGYTASVLQQYAALQRFTPRLHPKAVAWNTQSTQYVECKRDAQCCQRHPRVCSTSASVDSRPNVATLDIARPTGPIQ